MLLTFKNIMLQGLKKIIKVCIYLYLNYLLVAQVWNLKSSDKHIVILNLAIFK